MWSTDWMTVRVHRTGVQMESSPCEHLDSFMAEFWSTKIIVGAYGLSRSIWSPCVSARSRIASFVASVAIIYLLTVLEEASWLRFESSWCRIPPRLDTQSVVDRAVSAICRLLSHHPSRLASSPDIFLENSPRCCIPVTCVFILFIAVMCFSLGFATHLANSPVAYAMSEHEIVAELFAESYRCLV